MSAMIAYDTVDYGTWGVFQVRQTIDAHTPRKPPPPDFEPPTLTLLPPRKAVYAVGVELPVQNPATVRRETVTAQVIQRFHMMPRNDKRRVNSPLEWMYRVRINGVDWLLAEGKLTTAHRKVAGATKAPATSLKTAQRVTAKSTAEQSATPAA